MRAGQGQVSIKKHHEKKGSFRNEDDRPGKAYLVYTLCAWAPSCRRKKEVEKQEISALTCLTMASNARPGPPIGKGGGTSGGGRRDVESFMSPGRLDAPRQAKETDPTNDQPTVCERPLLSCPKRPKAFLQSQVRVVMKEERKKTVG